MLLHNQLVVSVVKCILGQVCKRMQRGLGARLARADVRSSLLQKVKLKIENNVICYKKVLQHGHKYPQNSLYSFLISFLNGYGHILTFKKINSSNNAYIFVARLRSLLISWLEQLLNVFYFQRWNDTDYVELFTFVFTKSFTKLVTKTFVFVFELTKLFTRLPLPWSSLV